MPHILFILRVRQDLWVTTEILCWTCLKGTDPSYDVKDPLTWSAWGFQGPFVTSCWPGQHSVPPDSRQQMFWILCCHHLFMAETKNIVCKISGAGKIGNICWDWEQLVAWEPCSKRPKTHQFCPCLLLFLQLLLVVGDIFAGYRTN